MIVTLESWTNIEVTSVICFLRVSATHQFKLTGNVLWDGVTMLLIMQHHTQPGLPTGSSSMRGRCYSIPHTVLTDHHHISISLGHSNSIYWGSRQVNTNNVIAVVMVWLQMLDQAIFTKGFNALVPSGTRHSAGVVIMQKSNDIVTYMRFP
jgi:hypothetical protein